MPDLTEIEVEGQFAACIRDYFTYVKPKKIIETGTYHGNGSTKVIASLIRDIPIPGAVFYSIECNAMNVLAAFDNLKKDSLMDFVKIVNGLSIPKEKLPTKEEIDSRIKMIAFYEKVKLDHEQDPGNASNYYQKETEQCQNDDRIGVVLNHFERKPDFVLLDSGGHIGKIEFDYLISKLEAPCAIALDDTRHIKHFESSQVIKSDPRFTVLVENNEKFGSMLVKFTPK